jgi:nucleotide-binding universal stress UspA family protein
MACLERITRRHCKLIPGLDFDGEENQPRHRSRGNVGDVVLSRASDEAADLIVMGAYGHSRLRELVLGGVSRALLGHMTVPVLMAH